MRLMTLIEYLKEDVTWSEPGPDRFGGLAGTPVSRASIQHEGIEYLVDFYDLGITGHLLGLPRGSYQVGFRPSNHSEYEGDVRTGEIKNARRLIRNVAKIVQQWMEQHDPAILLAGSSDRQKVRIFKMLAAAMQSDIAAAGYSVHEEETPVGPTIAFVKNGILGESILSERKMAGAAAKDMKTGKVYGPEITHHDVLFMDEMFADFLTPEMKANEYWEDDYLDMLWGYIQDGRIVDGFVSDDGQFYTREEAAKAIRLDPMKGDSAAGHDPKRDWLDSHDLHYVDDTIHEDVESDRLAARSARQIAGLFQGALGGLPRHEKFDPEMFKTEFLGQRAFVIPGTVLGIPAPYDNIRWMLRDRRYSPMAGYHEGKPPYISLSVLPPHGTDEEVLIQAIKNVIQDDWEEIIAHEVHHASQNLSGQLQQKSNAKFDMASGSKPDDETYFNDPTEFDAYYHQITLKLHRLLDTLENDPETGLRLADAENFQGDFKSDMDWAVGYKYDTFWQHLNDKRMRRFKTRLYKLHSEIVKAIESAKGQA